jgi:protease II
MRIAGQQFVDVLEAELGAQVPWTPGRIPEWNNE